MKEFAQSIINWYKSNKRELPWRETKDPYRIWISEVILQQTRVNQGIDYYNNFIKAFPNVAILATASEQEVLKIWQGLGYYSRARNLQYAAKQIISQFGGELPKSRKELLLLKGIGPYTSAAIASISFGLPHAAIDGNAYRVLSRCYAIYTPIDLGKSQKEFETLANTLMVDAPPADFNQAVMELGALICLPKNPLCHKCPLFTLCKARKSDSISLLPVKSKKKRVRKRYLNYLVFYNTERIWLTKREKKDIWQGLYEFPQIEKERLLSKREIACLLEKENPNYLTNLSQGIDIKHLLTHQELHIRFFHIVLPQKFLKIEHFNNEKITEIKLSGNTSLSTHKIITDELNRILLSQNK